MTCGLDDATQPNCHFFVVHPWNPPPNADRTPRQRLGPKMFDPGGGGLI